MASGRPCIHRIQRARIRDTTAPSYFKFDCLMNFSGICLCLSSLNHIGPVYLCFRNLRDYMGMATDQH